MLNLKDMSNFMRHIEYCPGIKNSYVNKRGTSRDTGGKGTSHNIRISIMDLIREQKMYYSRALWESALDFGILVWSGKNHAEERSNVERHPDGVPSALPYFFRAFLPDTLGAEPFGATRSHFSRKRTPADLSSR